jgi:hypothetical protein
MGPPPEVPTAAPPAAAATAAPATVAMPAAAARSAVGRPADVVAGWGVGAVMFPPAGVVITGGSAVCTARGTDTVTVTVTVFGTAKPCNPQGSQRLMG